MTERDFTRYVGLERATSVADIDSAIKGLQDFIVCLEAILNSDTGHNTNIEEVRSILMDYLLLLCDAVAELHRIERG